MSNTVSRKPRFRLFDIRNIIGALMEIYGVVLIFCGLFPDILADHQPASADNRVDLYIGTDANWWVGVALLAVAAIFFAWAYFRPVEDPTTESPKST